MAGISKGRSPFNPGQPVPVELFAGRKEQIEKILNRGVAQVAAGKPMAFFVQGEYGIGKTSIAGFTQWVADRDFGLHSIYTPLAGCRSLNDIAQAVLISTVRSGAFNPTRSEKIRNWLAKYVGKQDLFKFNINFEALKQDTPSMTNPGNMIDFLGQVRERLADTNVKGVFLVLDEINGVTSDPSFAYFIKSMVDTNALLREPVPLLLMLCGVAERRSEMIRCHQPVERIFEIVEIEVMTETEMVEFFEKAFGSVQMSVKDDAMKIMTDYSAGFPKVMHLVGDAAYWKDNDGIVDTVDALEAVMNAAEEFGKKFVENQIYKVLQSDDYLSILNKIAKMGPDIMSFNTSDVAVGLTQAEQKKFNNFLQRMKRLKVLRSGKTGEYIFISRMARLYIWLKTFRGGVGNKKRTNTNN